MFNDAMEGVSLQDLVTMTIPLCRAAQRACPRTGPGRHPEFEDWQIAVLIIVATLKKRKSKSAQYRLLSSLGSYFQSWLSLPRWPSRSTYFDRFKRAHRIMEKAIELQGIKAIKEGVAAGVTVAVDKSLIKGRGPVWGPGDRKKEKVPAFVRGVDRECAWGYSKHHGWVHGYSYEVVVCAGKNDVIMPLLGSFDVASASEHRSFAAKIDHLPVTIGYVLADSGYDNNSYGERIEYDEHDRRTGRRYLCPVQPRAHKARPGATIHRGKHGRSLERRRRRHAFLTSPKGTRLYARRSLSVEPFNQWFKHLFEMNEHVWHRGLDNNRVQLLAALFAYQLLIRCNYRRGAANGQIQWILDAL